MFCPKCGRDNTDGAAFCAGCGASLAGAPTTARKPNLSLAAGIIEIAFGCLGLVSALVAEVFLYFFVSDVEEFPLFVLLIPPTMIAPAIVAIVGGVFSLKRRSWVMALIGAIALLLTSSIPGVAALVLVIMGRDEFEEKPLGDSAAVAARSVSPAKRLLPRQVSTTSPPRRSCAAG